MTRLAAIVPLAAFVLNASAASAQSLPPLGTAKSFAVLGGSTVTNTGVTVVTGDLGTSPGIAVTGFPPGVVVGTIHAGDPVALQAQLDLTAAYNNLAGQASTSLMSGVDLGGKTLVAGVYTFAAAAGLTGDLTLDARGNASAVFVFQMGSTLTTAGISNVRLINGARACNVFWQVGSSATLGAGTTFAGNILALASVGLGTGVRVSGSVLARTGAVTLDNNTVSGCPANSAPVANAGPDQTTVFVGTTVTLDGSGSHDVDGNSLTFSWAFTARPALSAATLVNPSALNPSFTVDVPGTYVLQLTVNDGIVNSTPDTVTISTTNSAPVADAGLDQTALVGATVVLDGSNSHDADGNVLQYHWELTLRPAGSSATLSGPAMANPAFVIDVAGTYVAQLTVNDGLASSAPDAVTISTINSQPVANAGADRSVTAGDLVALDGTASSDADGDLLTFRWAILNRPAGSTAALSDLTAARPTFIADVGGTYLVQLIVNDGHVDSAPDTATIVARVVVPDVTGLTQLAAEAALGIKGLLRGAVTTEYHATVPAGAVIRQSPLAGTPVLPGSAVDVVLSLGPVPDMTAPAIAIAAPVASANYALNQIVLASYTCTDASGIASCTGTVANGAAIDTSSAGPKTFCVTAVDGVGNTSPSPQCVAYSVLAPPPVGGSLLGTAKSFAVLGGSTVTNTGVTVVTGDLGASPGIAVTGFPPGVVVGTIHAGDPVALQAQLDLTAAYDNLAGRASTSLMSGVDLGGTTLGAGVYTFAAAAQLTGDVTLDAQGNAGAIFIFQIGSTLTTAGTSNVRLINGARACNVFWQVGSSATLGAGTTFAGNILALASVGLGTGVKVSGSVLARIGAVTLDNNTVSVCEAPPVIPANQAPVAHAGPDQVVPFGILVRLDGSASSDDGRLMPLSYVWVSDTGFSAAGQVATVSLPLGRHVFTLTVHDGEFSAADAVTITVVDVTAPAIAIVAPVANAAYALDQIVLASYTCTDASGIASCTGTVANGAPIDTSSAGPKTFCVTAVDGVGNTSPSPQCASYSVLEPPTITITSPVEPIYELGSLVVAGYSCTGAATCTGGVASGSALDTGTPGLKSFTITATDAAGNTTTQVVTYTVSLGTCVMPLSGLTAWLPGNGTAIDKVSGTAGIWTGVETYAAGKVRQAFSVGNGNYVSLPFEQAGPFTMEAWVRAPNRLLPEFTGVLSTGGSGQSATSLQIELDGIGNYRLNVGNGPVSWLIGPALDFFQHVAVTFDGSTLATYLNGQLVQSDVWTESPGLGFHALNVGIDRDGLHPFTGVIDEVQVFNRALAADEVAQTFLTGASGLCNNRPPVAVALAAPNPAEATGPDGAIVSLDGTGSSDPDGDTLTCTWHEGATLLGTGCLLSTRLTIGSHAIALTVNDGQGATATGAVVVEVRDTTGPALSVPLAVFAEATSSLGATVFYAASATDAVSGAASITCAPESGSLFAIGSTVVTCSATDATGNVASVRFNVIVRDTIAPQVQIVSSPDALVSGSTFDVVVRANDIVGVAAVTVNGIAATRTNGTPQAGTWGATVPVALPVAPGSVLRFEVRAVDAAGNVGTATLLVDNDGIPAAMDRNRVTGADESGIYSNDFVSGPTAGTLTRNGWTVTLSRAPTPGGVRATISGSGGIARISACTGVAKEVRLDVIGETADITCASTGTITVKAISAVMQIELREQLAAGTWQQFNLRTGQSMSVGSPATASGTNTAAIAVQLLQVDAAGREVVVGGYQLAPGASVEVSMIAGTPRRDRQVRFHVLRGRVPVTVDGVTRTIERGKPATMRIDRTPPSS